MNMPEYWTRGVDVSVYQGGKFPFYVLQINGYRFAYIRASQGCYPDDRYMEHRARCRSISDLITGAYHYLKPDHAMSPLWKQALIFYNTMVASGALEGDELWPAIDYEAQGLTAADLETFIYHLLALHPFRQLVLYTSVSKLKEKIDPSIQQFIQLWVADAGQEQKDELSPRLPVGFDEWAFWQYGSSIAIPDSYPGRIDQNCTRMSLEWLKEQRSVMDSIL